MKRPSSEFLTHKFEAYEGCTLGELVFAVLLAYGLFVLALVVLALLGINRHLCFLSSVVGMYPVSKMAVKRLATIKKGKPHGYFMKQLRIRLSNSPLSMLGRKISYFHAPYVVREGRWSTVRMKKKEQ